MYSEKVMHRFKDPKNAGELADANGLGEVGNPACGDVMKVEVKVVDNIVVDAKFKTFGCCAAIAASDAVCELVKGKTVDEALAMTKQEIVDHLGGLPHLKIHCSVLGIDALKAAVKDYQEKQKK
jgi:nitrogen fixation NifU-like protein